MFEIISVNDKRWNEFISDLADNDIYYDSSYYKSLQDYQDSEIFLLAYSHDNVKICEVVQVNDISKFKKLTNLIPANTYFDLETPYGYGGICGNNITEEHLKIYFNKKREWANSQGLVSEFIRFNPLLDNQSLISDTAISINVKSTVFIKLESEEQIMSDMNCKNRNMVRKAIKSGVTIKEMTDDNKAQIIPIFKDLYKKTMERNHAEEFYFFTDAYFDNFFQDMKGKYKIFYAEFDGKIISASIFIFNNKNIHYYLSGADREYMNLAPNNLLLYEVAKWATEQGYKKFHLGGGVSDGDPLFGFKKQFNEKGILPFYIGRDIFSQEKFDYLVNLRKNNSKNFDMERKFLIKYRQEDTNE